MPYVPSRGDIVFLQSNPVAGPYIRESHIGLVVSDSMFNEHGMAIVCPIGQGLDALPRTQGTVVNLGDAGLETIGAVHCHEVRAIDLRARKVQFKEAIPDTLVGEVMARLGAILFD